MTDGERERRPEHPALPDQPTPKSPEQSGHDPGRGFQHGVPSGAQEEEPTGLPDDGRHRSETSPAKPEDGS